MNNSMQAHYHNQKAGETESSAKVNLVKEGFCPKHPSERISVPRKGTWRKKNDYIGCRMCKELHALEIKSKELELKQNQAEFLATQTPTTGPSAPATSAPLGTPRSKPSRAGTDLPKTTSRAGTENEETFNDELELEERDPRFPTVNSETLLQQYRELIDRTIENRGLPRRLRNCVMEQKQIILEECMKPENIYTLAFPTIFARYFSNLKNELIFTRMTPELQPKASTIVQEVMQNELKFLMNHRHPNFGVRGSCKDELGPNAIFLESNADSRVNGVVKPRYREDGTLDLSFTRQHLRKEVEVKLVLLDGGPRYADIYMIGTHGYTDKFNFPTPSYEQANSYKVNDSRDVSYKGTLGNLFGWTR